LFEQLDGSERKEEKDPITVAEGLGVYVLFLILAFVSFIAFIVFDDVRYGTQYATIITYSSVVFVYTFFRTRGINTRYPLDEPYVQELFPRLLLIHGAFLALVLIVETSALTLRPSLSAWWVTSARTKDMPPFEIALFLAIGAIAVTQVILSRSQLSRSKKASSSEPTEDEQ